MALCRERTQRLGAHSPEQARPKTTPKVVARLAVKRQHEGIGVRSSTTGNVFRRSYTNILTFLEETIEALLWVTIDARYHC